MGNREIIKRAPGILQKCKQTRNQRLNKDSAVERASEWREHVDTADVVIVGAPCG